MMYVYVVEDYGNKKAFGTSKSAAEYVVNTYPKMKYLGRDLEKTNVNLLSAMIKSKGFINLPHGINIEVLKVN